MRPPQQSKNDKRPRGRYMNPKFFASAAAIISNLTYENNEQVKKMKRERNYSEERQEKIRAKDERNRR